AFALPLESSGHHQLRGSLQAPFCRRGPVFAVPTMLPRRLVATAAVTVSVHQSGVSLRNRRTKPEGLATRARRRPDGCAKGSRASAFPPSEGLSPSHPCNTEAAAERRLRPEHSPLSFRA